MVTILKGILIGIIWLGGSACRPVAYSEAVRGRSTSEIGHSVVRTMRQRWKNLGKLWKDWSCSRKFSVNRRSREGNLLPHDCLINLYQPYLAVPGQVSEGCLEGVWKASGDYLEGVWGGVLELSKGRLCGCLRGCLEGYLESVRKF